MLNSVEVLLSSGAAPISTGHRRNHERPSCPSSGLPPLSCPYDRSEYAKQAPNAGYEGNLLGSSTRHKGQVVSLQDLIVPDRNQGCHVKRVSY
jgi:hypothetical protein